MQVRKVEVEERILESAKAEFLEKGYSGASVARIAKGAGVSVGNFYRYYADKASLLDAVVGKVYRYIPKFIADLASTITVMHMPLEEFSTFMSKEMLRVFWKHKTELAILLNKCKGTRYGKFRIVIERLVYAIVKSRNFGERKPSEHEKLIARLIATGYVNGLLEVLDRDWNGEDFTEPVRKLTLFFFDIIRN
ncbi:MAG: TetR/AcrR family transcriptional regulator [Clostridia bacterium]|nr:TetR/AcrR family transcriptional regulator [Clostridia bacterium]